MEETECAYSNLKANISKLLQIYLPLIPYVHRYCSAYIQFHWLCSIAVKPVYFMLLISLCIVYPCTS